MRELAGSHSVCGPVLLLHTRARTSITEVVWHKVSAQHRVPPRRSRIARAATDSDTEPRCASLPAGSRSRSGSPLAQARTRGMLLALKSVLPKLTAYVSSSCSSAARGPTECAAAGVRVARRDERCRPSSPNLAGSSVNMHMPCSAPSPPEALKQARLLRGLLQLVKPVEQGAAARPCSKLRLEECDALQGGLSLR